VREARRACGEDEAGEPEWGGDPAVVAAIAPLLAARADVLKDVKALEASCQRTERAADGSTRAVDDGRLVARRAPPCLVLTVTSPKPRSVREDATTRLVLEPLVRGATRWTFASNSALAGPRRLIQACSAGRRTLEVDRKTASNAPSWLWLSTPPDTTQRDSLRFASDVKRCRAGT